MKVLKELGKLTAQPSKIHPEVYMTSQAACKESSVRYPRASGFCHWASEFCF